MENASKALIIAGSIILAVLIIVLGMYFYNQAVGIGKNINMTELRFCSNLHCVQNLNSVSFIINNIKLKISVILKNI